MLHTMWWVAVMVAAFSVIGCGSPRPVQPAVPSVLTAPIEHRDMLALMERYLASPFGTGTDAPSRIIQFTIEDPEVTVEIDEKIVPFLTEDLDDGVKQLLLAGFMAGSVASQLRTGVKRHDPVGGVHGVLAVYRALRRFASTTLRDRKVIAEPALLSLQHALGQVPSPDLSEYEETFIMAMIKSWEEGRAEARAETQADAVLTVLHARGIAVPDAARERILAQKDLELLKRWLVKASIASSIGEVIGDPS